MKLYFIGPIAALAVFAAYTWHFDKDYQAKEAEKAAQVRLIRETKLQAEAEARKKAIADALASQQKLKKDRADKEADEARKKEVRQAALDARDKIFKEQERLTRTVERLKRETKVEQDAVAKLDATLKATEAEKEFHATFIAKAKENVAGLEDVLTKMDKAEAARVAAAAAAETPKKNS